MEKTLAERYPRPHRQQDPIQKDADRTLFTKGAVARKYLVNEIPDWLRVIVRTRGKGYDNDKKNAAKAAGGEAQRSPSGPIGRGKKELTIKWMKRSRHH